MLVTELRSLSDANRELIEGGLAAIGDALLSVQDALGRHLRRHRPHADDGSHRAVTLDGAL